MKSLILAPLPILFCLIMIGFADAETKNASKSVKLDVVLGKDIGIIELGNIVYVRVRNEGSIGYTFDINLLDPKCINIATAQNTSVIHKQANPLTIKRGRKNFILEPQKEKYIRIDLDSSFEFSTIGFFDFQYQLSLVGTPIQNTGSGLPQVFESHGSIKILIYPSPKDPPGSGQG